MNLRKNIPLLAILLILTGGFVAWRVTHPPRSDEQIILSRLESISQSAQKLNARGVTQDMTDSFRWQGLTKREINSHLIGFFYSVQDVQVNISAVNVQVAGEHAVSTGSYRVSYRMAPDTKWEIHDGRFKANWIKNDGTWRLQSAEGGDELSP